MCDYFRGEIPDPGDVECMETTQAQITRYGSSTDREFANLKAKYASRDDVMARLANYEERIEADR